MTQQVQITRSRFDARNDLVPLIETEERYSSSSGDIVIRWGVGAADGVIFVLRWYERGEMGAAEAGWRVSDQPGIPVCVGLLISAVAEALDGPAPPTGRAH